MKHIKDPEGQINTSITAGRAEMSGLTGTSDTGIPSTASVARGNDTMPNTTHKQHNNMSNQTPIQWHDDACNPSMGCEGCKEYPRKRLLLELILLCIPREADSVVGEYMEHGFWSMPTSEIFHRRREVAERMVPQCDENGRTLRDRIESAIVRAFRCQAGVLHLQHGLDPTNPDRQRNKEYAPTFEQVTLFPGRMATMAGMKDLTGTPRPDKPWLDGLPRMIKVGDMGDLMSSRVPFEYLRDEVVLTAISPKGRRHLWLWATRRPVRMAEFARWLRKEGLAWPRNLIPMASILDDHEPKGVSRLMEIKAVVRGLVIKDDVSNRRINFKGFRWVVIDCGTHTGNTHWLKSVASQCRHAGCALFIQHPDVTPWNEGRLWGLDDGTTDGLIEFTGDFRVREIPGEFRLFQGTGETSHEDFNARLAEFHANEQPRLASLSKRVSVERLAEFNRCDAILREFAGQMKKAGMD